MHETRCAIPLIIGTQLCAIHRSFKNDSAAQIWHLSEFYGKIPIFTEII